MTAGSSLRRARLIVLAVPVALLGGALGFEYLGGLYPCEMCWWQRYAHIAALACGVLAFAVPRSRLPVVLGGLALAAASGLGAYHAGVEYGWWQGLTACTSTVKFGQGDPLQAIMAAPLVRCDVVQWKLFGISLAGYNFIVSGLTAAAVFALLARTRKEQRA